MTTDENIKEYVEIRAQLKELKKRKENLSTLIKTDMSIQDIDTLQTEGGTARIVTFVKKLIDKEKLIDFCEETKQDLNYFYREVEQSQLKIEVQETEE